MIVASAGTSSIPHSEEHQDSSTSEEEEQDDEDEFEEQEAEQQDEDDKEQEDEKQEDEEEEERSNEEQESLESLSDYKLCMVCGKGEPDDEEVETWVLCETCASWTHERCIPTTHMYSVDDEVFICHMCCH